MKEQEDMREKVQSTPTRALFVYAHADDAEQFAGGTAAEMRSEGHETIVVDMTNGNRGTREHSAEYLSGIRHQEAEDAAKILDFSDRMNLGLDDSFVDVDRETLLRMVDLIRELNPDVVFTHAYTDHHHRDHEMTARLITLAVRMSSFTNLETKNEPTTKRIEVFFSEPQYATDEGMQIAPVGIVVSFSEKAAQTKERAFLAHKSQGLLKTPGNGKGDLTHLEMTQVWQRMRGLQVRQKYGEAFTQLMDSDHPPFPADRHPLVEMLPGRVYILPKAA